MYFVPVFQCPVQEVRNMLCVWRPETYIRTARGLRLELIRFAVHKCGRVRCFMPVVLETNIVRNLVLIGSFQIKLLF